MMTAVPPKKGLTDEEMVVLARFRMLSPGSRQVISETMWALNRRETQDAPKRPRLRLVGKTKGSV